MESRTITIHGVKFTYNYKSGKLLKQSKNGIWREVKGFLVQKKLYTSIRPDKKRVKMDLIIIAFILKISFDEVKSLRIFYKDKNPLNLKPSNLYLKTIKSSSGKEWFSRELLVKELVETNKTNKKSIITMLNAVLTNKKTSDGYNVKTLYGESYKVVNRTGEYYV